MVLIDKCSAALKVFFSWGLFDLYDVSNRLFLTKILHSTSKIFCVSFLKIIFFHVSTHNFQQFNFFYNLCSSKETTRPKNILNEMKTINT